jgi:hypothetical protein
VLSVRHIRDEVKSRLKARGVESLPRAWQFIGIDLVPAQTDLDEASPLPQRDYVLIRSGARDMRGVEDILIANYPPRSPEKGYEELIGWRADPKHFAGMNPLLGAGQRRALGRALGIAALQNSTIGPRIQHALQECISGGPELLTLAEHLGEKSGGLETPVTLVIVITSSAGGTGAGISMDVVEIIKRSSKSNENIQPVLIAYGSDIFAGNKSPDMSANSMTYLSELMNAMWSDSPGRNGVFAANNKIPDKRGPQYAFLIGRRNMKNIALAHSRDVYRAVGISIAGWITSASVGRSFQDHVLGNWMSVPHLGGFGFGHAIMPGIVSSFGSSTVALGRKRFREYAAKLLLREIYEFHSRGYRQVAKSYFGQDADRGIDAAIRARLVQRFLPEVLESCGLSNPFDALGRPVADGSAQITEALLSSDHLRQFGGEVMGQILGQLPLEAMRGGEWEQQIDSAIQWVKRDAIAAGVQEFRVREERWLGEVLSKVLASVNDVLSKATLPVTEELVRELVQDVLKSVIGFRNQGQIATQRAAELGVRFRDACADIGNSKLDKDSPQVDEAVEYAAGIIAQELKAQASVSIAQTLEQVASNLLQPISTALVRAKNDVEEMTEPRFDQPPETGKWPTGDVIPESFVPSPIEHLLEDYREWPQVLRGLLRTAETPLPGEDTSAAVRRGICGGVMEAQIDESQVRPILWLREDVPLAFTRNQPLPIRAELEFELLEDRIEKWLTRGDRELGRYLNEGLERYLGDTNHIDHDRRIAKFKEKLQMAMAQASPFVTLDETYFQTTYKKAPQQVFTMEPIPFQKGHPAHDTAVEVIKNAISDDSPINFTGQDVESVTASCFLKHPIFPGIVASVMNDLAEEGGKAGQDTANFRAWLSYKRAHVLDESIPLPDNAIRALIRGYAVGRITGLVSMLEDNVAAISAGGEVLRFPSPAFAKLGEIHGLASILMSMQLGFLKVSQQRETAFRAYGALFELGVNSPEDDPYHPDDYRVSAELQSFIETGSTSSAPIEVSVQAQASREERIDAAKALLGTSIKLYEDLLAAPLSGKEYVGQGMRWNDSATPSREIAKIAAEEYRRTLGAIEKYQSVK